MGRRALTIRSWESLLWIVSPRYFQSYILRKSPQETSAISAALKGLICWYGEVWKIREGIWAFVTHAF